MEIDDFFVGCYVDTESPEGNGSDSRNHFGFNFLRGLFEVANHILRRTLGEVFDWPFLEVP